MHYMLCQGKGPLFRQFVYLHVSRPFSGFNAPIPYGYWILELHQRPCFSIHPEPKLTTWALLTVAANPSCVSGFGRLLYCVWPETALLAKCEDRACQGAVAGKAQF